MNKELDDLQDYLARLNGRLLNACHNLPQARWFPRNGIIDRWWDWVWRKYPDVDIPYHLIEKYT